MERMSPGAGVISFKTDETLESDVVHSKVNILKVSFCVDIPLICGPDEFNCTSSRTCIFNAWLCDGDNDCPKGEDEQPSAGCSKHHHNV